MTALTADAETRVLAVVPADLLIGGQWWPARDGGTFPVEDPATGQVLCQVADGSVEDGLAALAAAAGAQQDWAAHPARERGEILRRGFEAITARAGELALLMTLEMGKPVGESHGEVTYAAEFLRWFAEQAVRINGLYAVAPSGAGRLLTMQEPVGPCLLITPWNFPMAMGTRKIAPAVAAGRTVPGRRDERRPPCRYAYAYCAPRGEPDGYWRGISRPAESHDDWLTNRAFY